MVTCAVCKEELKDNVELSYHFRREHKLKAKEYYDKYIKKENEGICSVCGQKTRFTNIKDGYRVVCSRSCSRRSIEVIEKMKQTSLERYGCEYSNHSKQAKEKRKQTSLEKYGVEHFTNRDKCISTNKEKYGVAYNFQTKETVKKIQKTKKERYGDEHYNNRDKQKQTARENGFILPEEELEPYQLYKRKVDWLSEQNAKRKFTEDELAKRGRCGTKGAVQLDHMYSKVDGFRNGILPWVIAHECNLQLISWKENNRKRDSSCLGIDTLLEDINTHNGIGEKLCV